MTPGRGAQDVPLSTRPDGGGRTNTHRHTHSRHGKADVTNHKTRVSWAHVAVHLRRLVPGAARDGSKALVEFYTNTQRRLQETDT